jgi:hypothetical protein
LEAAHPEGFTLRIPSSDGPAIRHKSLRFTRTIRESYIERRFGDHEPEILSAPEGLWWWDSPAGLIWFYEGDIEAGLYDWCMGIEWDAIGDDEPITRHMAAAARSNIQRRRDTRESARPRSPQRP